MSLHLIVHGVPAPQGSKRYLGNGIAVESSKRVAPWRADIQRVAESALSMKGRYDHLWEAPLAVNIQFAMPRPKAHYRTGKKSHLLREDAPRYHVGKPDTDKLMRAVLDALTGVVFKDDSRVAELIVTKEYGDRPHCRIDVTELATPTTQRHHIGGRDYHAETINTGGHT